MCINESLHPYTSLYPKWLNNHCEREDICKSCFILCVCILKTLVVRVYFIDYHYLKTKECN